MLNHLFHAGAIVVFFIGYISILFIFMGYAMKHFGKPDSTAGVQSRQGMELRQSIEAAGKKLKLPRWWRFAALGIIIAVPLVLLPIAGVIAREQNNTKGPDFNVNDLMYPTYEFVTGTWPDGTYTTNNTNEFSGGYWLFNGLVLRVWGMFVIPMLTSLAVTWFVGGRIARMRLYDYISSRDKFVRTEIMQNFREVVMKGGMNDEEFREELTKVIDSASERWLSLQNPERREILREVTFR
jgi:hypothetical protein